MIKNYLNNRPSETRIGLALGGGGARGLAHLKVLEVLEQLELRPSLISGTSIGSLIGALYCSGMSPKEIESEFRDMDLFKAGSLFDVNFKNTNGLIKGKKIEKFLKKKTSKKKFKDLEIPLKIVATDFWGGKQVIIDTGPVYRAVRASISIAGIFEPVKLGGRILLDGGYVNPVPYQIIKNDCDITIAVDVTGSRLSEAKEGEKPNIFECIISAFQITQEVIVKNKMSSSPPDIYIKPLLENIQVLEFNRMDYILAQAEKDAARFKEILSALT